MAGHSDDNDIAVMEQDASQEDDDDGDIVTTNAIYEDDQVTTATDLFIVTYPYSLDGHLLALV